MPRTRALVGIPLLFVAIYSILPHKELRFIFPALPLLNLAGRDASEPFLLDVDVDIFAAADRGTNGSLSFPSSIFSTSATMFLVPKIVTVSLLQSTSCREHVPRSAAAKKTNDPLTRRARASIRTSRNSEHYITLASS